MSASARPRLSVRRSAESPSRDANGGSHPTGIPEVQAVRVTERRKSIGIRTPWSQVDARAASQSSTRLLTAHGMQSKPNIRRQLSNFGHDLDPMKGLNYLSGGHIHFKVHSCQASSLGESRDLDAQGASAVPDSPHRPRCRHRSRKASLSSTRAIPTRSVGGTPLRRLLSFTRRSSRLMRWASCSQQRARPASRLSLPA